MIHYPGKGEESMKQRFLALGSAAVLALSLIAGCQSVGGVEPDKVVQNALGVQSFEGSGSLTVSFTPGEAREGYPDLTPLNNAVLVLSDIKMQDKTHTSANGELRYGTNVIPFQAAAAGEDKLLQVQGAHSPLILDGKAKKAAGGGAPSFSLDLSSLNLKTLLQNHLASLLQYMPTPESLTVTDAKEKINGEELSLKKLHVELKGDELSGLIKTTLKNVLKDDEGGTALIKSILKDAGFDPDNAFIYSFIRQALTSASEDLSALPESFGVSGYLKAGNSLKLDVYTDADSQIRRLEFDLGLTGLDLHNGAVTGLAVKGNLDFWNINKPVTADTISSEGAVSLSEPGALIRFIKSMDKDSQVYKLLMNDLKITRKNIVLPPIEDGLPGETVRPYIDNGSTLVPVRFVSENLDAQVEWNGEAQQVTVTDILSGKKLVFTIGSNIVTVDGKEVKLEAAAALTNGSTYVPVRFIAESLGADVGWVKETRTVSIVRN